MEFDQLIPYINASPRLPLIIGQQAYRTTSSNLFHPSCQQSKKRKPIQKLDRLLTLHHVQIGLFHQNDLPDINI
jgi:hypothetical protein